MNFKKFLVVSFLFLLFTQNLQAFDGNRKGFILGFGAGFSSLTSKIGYENSSNKYTEGYVPFVTNFKIGGGVNEQILIYWSSKVNWFSRDEKDNKTWISGIGTISGSYYLKPDIKSFFLSGGIGYASYQAPFETDNQEEYTYDPGLAFFIGGGYEFAKHFSVETGICYGSTSKDFENNGKNTYKNAVLFVTINALAF